jgi:hydroxyacylglutathione hydrolase
MFVGGCGNFNSGTPAQMYAALCVKLNALPGDTEVFVGHEYTRRNLAFAATVEPDNAALRAKLEWAGGAEQTVPTTIASERATNPFVRATEPAVQDYVRRMFPDEKWDGIDAAEAVGVQTLRLVRRAKDEWGQTH